MITLAGLAAFLLLMPFYVLPSGLPQPAHILFLAVLVAAFFRREHRRLLTRDNDVFIVLLAAYIAWTITINVLHLTTTITIEPFVYNFYYFFGGLFALSLFIVTAAPSEYRWGYTQLDIIFGVIAATLALQLVISLSGIGRSFYLCRSMNFFNNPNQLGYFAVLVSTLGALIGEKANIRRPVIYALLGAGLLLALFSVSRAAVLATVGGISAFIILYERDFRVWLIAIAGGVLLYANNVQSHFVLSNTPACAGRIANLDIPELPTGVANYGLDPARDFFGSGFQQKLPAAAKQTPEYCLEKTKASESEFMRQVRYRQYHHLFVNPKLLLLGAGDGRNERFCGLEIHSTLGAALLYHGLVGLALLALLVLRLAFIDWRATVFALAPAMLYGFTHNGLRNPLLFGLMAAVLGVNARERRGTGSTSSDAASIPSLTQSTG